MSNRVWAIWNIYTKELEILSSDLKELSDKTGLNKEVFDSMLEEDVYIVKEFKIHCRNSSKAYPSDNKDRKESILNKYIELKALEEMIGLKIHFKYSNDARSFTDNDGTTKGDYIGIYLSNKDKPSNRISDYEWLYIGDKNIFF